jgi:hypothetical protein
VPRACPDGMLTAEALVPIRSVYRHRPGLSALGDSLEANIANPPLAAVASHERLLCENPSVVTLRRSDDPQAANVGRAWLGVDDGAIVHCVFDRVLGGKGGRHQRNEQETEIRYRFIGYTPVRSRPSSPGNVNTRSADR